MPTPNAPISMLRPDIGDAFSEFDIDGNAGELIGYRVLPIFDVQLQRGTYPVIPVEDILQASKTARSNRSGYNMIDIGFEDAPYVCREHGLSSPVDDRLAMIYQNLFEQELETTRIVRHRVLIEAEKRVAAKVFDPAAFNTTAVTNEWDKNHISDATPMRDVQAAKESVYARTGVWPNALIINRQVFQNLRLLDEIVDAIQSSGAGHATKLRDITADMLAQVFDLDMVLVAGGTQNLSNEGQAFSPGHVWSGDFAMVASVATSSAFSEVAIGRTLHWSEDGSEAGTTVETYRNEDLRRTVVRVRHDVDERLIYTDAGQLLTNVTTAA
ncbi:MAG: hypothetical protein AAGG38_10825 [Planctomycetota bacterium]